MFSVGTAIAWIIKTFGYDKRANEERDKDIAAIKLAQSRHFEECDDRHQHNAITKMQVDRMDREMTKFGNTLAWMGDCIIGIGTEMGAKLPNRPNGN